MTRLKLQSAPHLLYAAVSVLNHAIPVDQRLATCSVLNSFFASHVNLLVATYTFFSPMKCFGTHCLGQAVLKTIPASS